MRRLKLIVSDFHIGRGKKLSNGQLNPLEEFFYDDQFIEFLEYHSKGEFLDAEIELIFNGDFFDHLQSEEGEFNPDIIDEELALMRTEKIIQGHLRLFEALRGFASLPDHSVTFVLGNHDPGLLFVSVQEKLRQLLGDSTQFENGPYLFEGVHVEHGNQFFADNAYNKKKYFLTKGLKKPILNLPWGSFFVIHFLNKVKKARPYFAKIYPFKFYLRWALIHDTLFALQSIFRIIFYFIWLRFRRDPTRSSPIFKTLRIILEVPSSPKLDREAKKILLSERDIKTVIFGHIHHATIRQFAPNKTYINTGVWNEVISLEVSDPGKIVKLTYAQLDYDKEENITPSLKEWRGAYKIVEDVHI